MNRFIVLTALMLPALGQGVEAQLRQPPRTCAVLPASSPLCATPSTGNRGRLAAPIDSVPTSVVAAETHGQRFRRPSGRPQHLPPDSVKVIGTPERKCVTTDSDGTDGIARSGEIIAGNFAKYDEVWRSGYGKIWWHPTYWRAEDVAETLVVRATRLDKDARSYVFEQPVPKLGAHAFPPFLPSGFTLPSTGKWLLVASVGDNWGCFIYNLRS